MTLTRTLADFEREEKKIKVSPTKVRVRSDQAIELAVRAGVEDSLEAYAREHSGEPFPEFPSSAELVGLLAEAVTDGVGAELSRLLTFEDEE